MSARTRCPKCEHPRKRIISATVQTGKKNARAEAKVRKKSCDCDCHRSAS